jgi:hypothetical protein
MEAAEIPNIHVHLTCMDNDGQNERITGTHAHMRNCK